MLNTDQITWQGQHYFTNQGNQFWGQFNGVFTGTFNGGFSGGINISQITPGTWQAGNFVGNASGTTLGSNSNPITFYGTTYGTFYGTVGAENTNWATFYGSGIFGYSGNAATFYGSGTVGFSNSPATFYGSGTFGYSASPASFYGNGTFGTNGGGSAFNGNGSALTNLTGANVTGVVPAANAANAALTVPIAGVTSGAFAGVTWGGPSSGTQTLGTSGDANPVVFWGSFNSASGTSSTFDGDFKCGTSSTTSFYGATTFYGTNVVFEGNVTLSGDSSYLSSPTLYGQLGDDTYPAALVVNVNDANFGGTVSGSFSFPDGNGDTVTFYVTYGLITDITTS